jgi:acetyl esterase/lipase
MTTTNATKRFRTERGVTYATPGGKKLKATVYMPEEDPVSPVLGLVQIHGGGWFSGTRYQQAWYCRQFARHGIVVMTIDYRMLPRYPFPHCVHDAKAAVRWLRHNASKYRVDPERIAAFGASAGGHLAGFLATTGPEHGFEGDENLGVSSAVCAAISLYGAVDLTKYRDGIPRGPLSGIGHGLIRKLIGQDQPGAEHDAFEIASPITYASAETCPVMLVHGTADSFVHFGQSQAFHDRLSELGVPTRLIPVAGQHGFDFVHHGERQSVFDEMLAFLADHADTRPPEAQDHGSV